MLTPTELQALSFERLEDAKVLFEAKRYEGAVYICGYANELALKRRICLTLGWTEYPDDGKGSDKYKSFKTHELEILLHLSGFENQIKSSYFAEWSIVVSWKPEMRYSFRKQSDAEAKLMIQSSERLLKIL